MMPASRVSASGSILMTDIQHFINGKHVEATSGRWGDVFNPATGERAGRVALGGAAEVDRAVRAARRRFRAGPRPRR